MKPMIFKKKSDREEKRKKIKSVTQSERKDKKSQRRASRPKRDESIIESIKNSTRFSPSKNSFLHTNFK